LAIRSFAFQVWCLYAERFTDPAEKLFQKKVTARPWDDHENISKISMTKGVHQLGCGNLVKIERRESDAGSGISEGFQHVLHRCQIVCFPLVFREKTRKNKQLCTLKRRGCIHSRSPLLLQFVFAGTLLNL